MKAAETALQEVSKELAKLKDFLLFTAILEFSSNFHNFIKSFPYDTMKAAETALQEVSKELEKLKDFLLFTAILEFSSNFHNFIKSFHRTQ